MATKETREPRELDREAEEKRQQDVIEAVHDATHDKDGNPIPILAPVAGVKTFGGKT